MSSKRWQKIEEIFEQVVELPASERDGVLANLCNGDDDLRREVELLIAADSEAEEFIEEPILGSNTLASFLNEDFGQDIENSVPPHFIGRRIGAYRLIRELGRGGMGAVFLAQRADDEFKKSVAIKLIKRGMDTDFILKRFRNERQILATLDHPYIARLLDGGTTDDNLPYFVMEYIEGEPIHHYCDANRLTLRERLQLFQNVCSAVNYAHQNLIIHRDLKPGNILVTKDSAPKLLDFGIAKILNPALAADTLAPTLTGMRLMTPEYASPEQIRGEVLTPSSDIYSLGVLLYEILTGKRPYRFSSRAPHEIARVICEEEPENPATVLTNGDVPIAAKKENKDEKTIDLVSRNRRATPETLRRELSGNLQNILLKALRKSPSNRYASADDFARDIQAYLDGMPVSAPSISTTDERFDDSHSPQESLAVLPFRTFHWKAASNGDIDTGDFLSVGLADALISRLSNLKTISVRPTSSVVKFVSDTIEPEAAGRELNVSHVLDGRIQHIGKRVRVTAQLIRTRNNETVWAGQFDEESDDILSLQDSISSQVAHALSLQLTGEEREKIQKRGTNNAKAYECYLRGRFYWHTFEVEGLAKALVCFYEAIAQDPNFALAYTGVADYYNFISVFGLMPPGESFPAAKEAAQKAIELDNTLAEAYTSLGITAFGYDWDFKEAERLFKRSLELNPNYGEAHLWYAHLLSQQGKNEQALKEMRRAEKLNTVSPSLLVNYAFCLRNARKFQEAFDKIRQALTIQPNHYIALQGYTWIVKHLDVANEALKALEKAIERSDRLALPLYGYGYVLATIGRNDEAREIVKELEEIKQKRYIPAIYMVLIYTELGERDLAFKWLEQCFVERDFWTIWLPVDPRLEALRSDPRFNLYVRRIRPVNDEEIHQSHIPTKILPAGEKGEFAIKPEEKAIAAGAQRRPNPNFRRNAALAISALGLLLVVFLAGLKFGWHFGFGNQGNNGTYLHGAHHES
ncbi:MAG TPA: protein kinase, partial [Pyrinomonadaceae bacterium]|nr:protein kinase [Pyrinomonadaceae bacterium]